jgi:C4-dicarboxylate-specific signal transduction histidine kinase
LRNNDRKPVGILTVSREITERKLAEKERENLQSQLLQAQKMEAVGRLAGGVAHDFNNMLSAIIGHAQLAMMKSNPSEPVYTNLKMIEDIAHRSASLTRQLWAFARKQIMPYPWENIQSGTDFRQNVTSYTKQIRHHRIDLDVCRFEKLMRPFPVIAN